MKFRHPLAASTRDTAVKNHVASFHGHNFVAERDGEDLHIFQLTDDVPVGGVQVHGPAGTTTGDSLRVVGASPAEINRRNAEWFKRPA